MNIHVELAMPSCRPWRPDPPKDGQQRPGKDSPRVCLADPTMVYRDVVVPPCVLSYDAVDEGEETAGKSKTTKQLKYEDGSIKAPALTRPVGVKTPSGYVRVWRMPCSLRSGAIGPYDE